MKTVQVQIRGTAPLLVHRFTEQSEAAPKTRRIEMRNADPRVEAGNNAYTAPDGTFFFSAAAIPAAMGAAGASHKAVGSRKTLRFIVPSAVRTTSDAVTILDGEGPAATFEVDSRPVTIPATKGRVMRHRPRWNNWGAVFDLVIDDNLLNPDTALQLLSEAGQSIGIGDFRPEKRGPFGTFVVTSWQDVG